MSNVSMIGEGGKGLGYGGETMCYVCKNMLKRVKTVPGTEKPRTLGRGEDVYACENGHVYSSEALVELDSYILM
ncbi:MAG: hypothetical protein ACE5KA_08485 [Nitrososphaerales archaeon]